MNKLYANRSSISTIELRANILKAELVELLSIIVSGKQVGFKIDDSIGLTFIKNGGIIEDELDYIDGVLLAVVFTTGEEIAIDELSSENIIDILNRLDDSFLVD
jgi:hypothetical protein